MPPEPTVQITVRVPVDHARALEEIGRANDRTLSAELRRVIRHHIERVRSPDPREDV
jgi:predicted transcriptional regulator